MSRRDDFTPGPWVVNTRNLSVIEPAGASFDPVRGKPRRSGRGRIARTA